MIKIKSVYLVVFGGLSLALGCARDDDGRTQIPVPPKSEPNAVAVNKPEASAATPTVSGGGQRDLRPRVLILTPTRGSSSVDVNPLILAKISCETSVCMTDVAGTTARVAARLRFLDPAGKVATVVPQVAPTSDSVTAIAPSPDKIAVGNVPMTEYTAKLVPGAALAPDSAYVLEVESNGEFVIGFRDAMPSEGAAALSATSALPFASRISLFTGSAPRLVAINSSIGSGKASRILQLRFSEPVQIGDLLSSAFGVELPGGKFMPGCVLAPSTGRCVSTNVSEVGEGVDFEAADVLPSEGELAQSAIVISGRVRGSGRTVAEGARARGSAVQTTSLGTGIRQQLTAADWTDCAGGGKCVRELK